MLTRRKIILMGAALTTVRTSVWGFDADWDRSRYRDWLTRFKQDLSRIRTDSSDQISEKEISIVCKSSVVPHSRMAHTLNAWHEVAGQKRNVQHGAVHYVDISAIVMLLLESSILAGYGGLFPEAPESGFASKRLSVWYMHIDDTDALQAYFDDELQFSKYELPPDGVLRRHAYPFLLFEDTRSTLRLAGIGAEWMGAALYLYRKQFA